MRFLHVVSLAVAAAVGLSMVVPDTAEAKRKQRKPASCAMVTGEGTAITEAIARASASNSLDQVAARVGGKRVGKAKVTCTKGIGGIIDTCQASQRVCK